MEFQSCAILEARKRIPSIISNHLWVASINLIIFSGEFVLS